MRRAWRLAWVMGVAIVCLLALPSAALADRFPATDSFNGLVITYSVSGAQMGAPVDSEGFTTSREITGTLTGGRLEVSGTADASSGWSAALAVTVNAGENSKSFTAASPPAPHGLDKAPWSQSFSVAVDVPKSAAGGSFSISLSGEYNAGGRALEVDGSFEGGGAAGETTTTIGAAGGASGAAAHKGGKVPGPGSWWKVLAGALVPGIIAGGLSLTSGLFGGGGVVPTAPKPSRPKYTPPPGTPGLGPARPYRETPDGPLIYPPGTQPPPGSRPRVSPEAGPSTEHEAYEKTMVDVGKAFGKGVYDFARGTLSNILTGVEEIGLLGFEWTDSRGPSVLKALHEHPWETLSIIPYTFVNIGSEIAEGVNPVEELKSLNDPNMSEEGKAWAVSSMALKIANVILIKDSLKDLKDGLLNEPKTPLVPRGEEVILDPAARTSKMTPSEAVAQAEKTVPPESVAEFEKYKSTVDSAVDDFTKKVNSGEPITPEDVLEVTKDPASTRQVLGKTKTDKPIPSEVTDAVKDGRRKIYDGTDKRVADELKRTNSKYEEGTITKREVSTGGEADATGSADRDVMYVHEKQVVGKDGTTRTVQEPVPAEDVKAIHNKAFAEETNFDPAKPANGIDKTAWDQMSLEQKQAAHAEQYGQNVMDRTSDEFIVEYRTDGGPGKLTSDPAQMGKTYQEVKFKDLWEKGTPEKQTEALHQLGKEGDVADAVATSKGKVLDPQTSDALDIVNKGGIPSVVDQAVKNLGVQGGVEGLANRLRSIIESKKWK